MKTMPPPRPVPASDKEIAALREEFAAVRSAVSKLAQTETQLKALVKRQRTVCSRTSLRIKEEELSVSQELDIVRSLKAKAKLAIIDESSRGL